MKKTKKLFTTLMSAAVITCMAVGLTACGSTPAEDTSAENNGSAGTTAPEVETAAITDTYLNSYLSEEGFSCVESVKLREDGSYEMTLTQIASHDGDVMATYAIITTGTYEKGEMIDGFAELSLSEADLILYDATVYHGMFHISIDSANSTFPAELVGGEMISEEEYKSQYGESKKYYIVGDADGSETNELLTELP